MSGAAATLAALGRMRVVAVVRAPDPAAALRVADALLEGGVRAIELTCTTPRVQDAVAELTARAPEAVVGVGTITRPEQVAMAHEAGAAFLVSPGSPPALVAAMAATGLATLAGCLTPTEVVEAREAGADAIKLFPASLCGPGYLAALRGPFPDLAVVPTGGIALADVDAWLAAGALAVGVGGELARPVGDPDEHRAVADAARLVGSSR